MTSIIFCKRQALIFLSYFIQLLYYSFILHDIHYVTGMSYQHYALFFFFFFFFFLTDNNFNLRCSGKLTFLNNNLFSPLQIVFNANTCLALTVKAKILKTLQIRFRNIACCNWNNLSVTLPTAFYVCVIQKARILNYPIIIGHLKKLSNVRCVQLIMLITMITVYTCTMMTVQNFSKEVEGLRAKWHLKNFDRKLSYTLAKRPI